MSPRPNAASNCGEMLSRPHRANLAAMAVAIAMNVIPMSSCRVVYRHWPLLRCLTTATETIISCAVKKMIVISSMAPNPNGKHITASEERKISPAIAGGAIADSLASTAVVD
jgi:hypothetical protein